MRRNTVFDPSVRNQIITNRIIPGNWMRPEVIVVIL